MVGIVNQTGRETEPHRHALSLIEVVAATLIVGLMAVAALNGLGAATRSSMAAGDQAIALGLAGDLMAEILPAAYSEPDDTAVFGPETGESTGDRTLFDDVDDYNGWDSQPPESPDGTAIPDRTDWRRRVIVECVQRDLPTQATTGNVDEGAKRIRVVVEHDGVVLAEQVFVRTDTDD